MDESEPIGEELTLKALRAELGAGEIRSDVLRALVDLSPQTRLIVDEMILAAGQADRRGHDGGTQNRST
ncbi:hypothetical protein [Actinomadura sp. 6N118]|uniref:hypothetical protein n=1 Tax=Actinomadura sp. 6N118 TaxID=3375151 RepID=UPI0037BF39EA